MDKRLSLVKSKKRETSRKRGDEQLLVCPKCKLETGVEYSAFYIVYYNLHESDGLVNVDPKKRDMELRCKRCNTEVAQLVNGKWKRLK